MYIYKCMCVCPSPGGCAACLRHLQASHLRECGALAEGAARPRRAEHCRHARRKQGKHHVTPYLHTYIHSYAHNVLIFHTNIIFIHTKLLILNKVIPMNSYHSYIHTYIHTYIHSPTLIKPNP